MTDQKIAARMDLVETSASAMMSQRAREMKAEGLDVIALSSGQPDFPTPAHVLEAANAAAKRGETKYTSIGGSNEMKDAAIAKFKRGKRPRLQPQRNYYW